MEAAASAKQSTLNLACGQFGGGRPPRFRPKKGPLVGREARLFQHEGPITWLQSRLRPMEPKESTANCYHHAWWVLHM